MSFLLLSYALSNIFLGPTAGRCGLRKVLTLMARFSSDAAISFGLAALVFVPIVSVLLVVWGMMMWGIGTPIYYAIMQRIIPAPNMATGIGLDNGLTNFGSAKAPAVTGFLIAATGSNLAGLLFIAGLGLIGTTDAAVLAMERY